MSKTALITGSSRGIGREAALEFARHGYNLIINGRSSSNNLNSLETQIKSMGVQVLKLPGNVGNPIFVKELINTAQKQFGGIDVLVNNAGISYVGLLTEMSLSDWDNIISINLSSVFYCCREAIPDMVRKKSGRIINVSSVWGNVGASCEAAYSASKGGIAAFTKAVAKELAPSGISVNAIAFGAVDTDMNQCFSPDELLSLAEEIPAGRLAFAAEAGKMIYETSNLPEYMTGQVIGFDGGWC